jgi:hypothetical protein
VDERLCVIAGALFYVAAMLHVLAACWVLLLTLLSAASIQIQLLLEAISNHLPSCVVVLLCGFK